MGFGIQYRVSGTSSDEDKNEIRALKEEEFKKIAEFHLDMSKETKCMVGLCMDRIIAATNGLNEIAFLNNIKEENL